MSGLFMRFGHDEDMDDQDVMVRSDSSRKRLCCGLTRCSLGALCVCMIIIISLIIALFVTHVEVAQHNEEHHSDDSLPICDTPECIQVAGELLSKMNLSADPCEDFYNYVCGGYEENVFLPPTERKWGTFQSLAKKNKEYLNNKLNKPGSEVFGVESEGVEKAKQFFKQCMDDDQIEEAGGKYLKAMIKEMGSWSITSDDDTGGEFNVNKWDFEAQLAYIHKTDAAPLFAITVEPDDRDSTVNLLQISQHGLSLTGRDDYSPETNRTKLLKQAFLNYGMKVAELLGAPAHDPNAKSSFEQIYDLEKKLAALYVAKADLRNSTKVYHKTNLSEIQDVAFGGGLNLLDHLAKVRGRNFTNETQIVTKTLPYLVGLKGIIQEYLSTPENKTILNNYLTWYAIDKSLSLLSNDWYSTKLILTKETSGISSLSERWEHCTSLTDKNFDEAVSALYVEDRFGENDQKMVEKIVGKVREHMMTDFANAKWMDADTVVAAKEKASAINLMIGSSEKSKNVTAIDEYYSTLEINEFFFSTSIQIRQWTVEMGTKRLDEAPDRMEWHMTGATVNAYYSPTSNNVVLPAGILQNPFFNRHAPLALNYGALGAVFGHELSHGFDDEGSQYDKDGNLVNWWGDGAKKGFSEAASCFNDQYSQYHVTPNLTVNGSLTLGENIADNGGVYNSYMAYLQLLDDEKPEIQRLPGLNFTDDQLFFIGFSQLWCAKVSDAYRSTAAKTDPHSPPNFRVQGVMSNSQGFTDAFQCRYGQSLYPDKRCKVW